MVQYIIVLIYLIYQRTQNCYCYRTVSAFIYFSIFFFWCFCLSSFLFSMFSFIGTCLWYFFLQYLLIIMYYCYVNEYLYIRVPLKRNSLANHCLGHTTRNTVTGNTTKKTTLTFYQWAAWPEMAPSSEERETRVSCPDTLFWVSIHVFHKFYWLNS